MRKRGSLAPWSRAPVCGQLGQVGDDLGRDPLPGEQLGHARRVARDRLARDPADRVGDPHHLGLAEERVARRHGHLAEQHLRRPDDRGGRAGLGDPLDRLLDVAGEPPERLGRVRQPDDQHDRGLRRAARRGRRRSAAAHPPPRSRCSRCRARRSRSASGRTPAIPERPTSDASTSRIPSIVSSLARATAIASSASWSNCSP